MVNERGESCARDVTRKAPDVDAARESRYQSISLLDARDSRGDRSRGVLGMCPVGCAERRSDGRQRNDDGIASIIFASRELRDASTLFSAVGRDFSSSCAPRVEEALEQPICFRVVGGASGSCRGRTPRQTGRTRDEFSYPAGTS